MVHPTIRPIASAPDSHFPAMGDLSDFEYPSESISDSLYTGVGLCVLGSLVAMAGTVRWVEGRCRSNNQQREEGKELAWMGTKAVQRGLEGVAGEGNALSRLVRLSAVPAAGYVVWKSVVWLRS
jgi:hypothetical protein